MSRNRQAQARYEQARMAVLVRVLADLEAAWGTETLLHFLRAACDERLRWPRGEVLTPAQDAPQRPQEGP